MHRLDLGAFETIAYQEQLPPEHAFIQLERLGTVDDPAALVADCVLRAGAQLDGIRPEPLVLPAKGVGA